MKLEQEDGIGLILQYSLTRMCNYLAVVILHLCFHLCLVNVRRFFAQRYSPFDMGDFCVLATTRRTRVRLRVAVLHKSPHLKRFRSASGRINAAVGIFDIVRLAVSSLFARLGISLRLLSRRSSPIRVALLRRSP